MRPMPPICATCKSWDQRYPENKQLGVCKRMGVTNWGDGQRVSVHVNQYGDEGHVVSDFPVVSVRAEFGCREHSDNL